MCVYTNLFYILLYSENVYYCVSIYKYAHHKIHLWKVYCFISFHYIHKTVQPSPLSDSGTFSSIHGFLPTEPAFSPGGLRLDGSRRLALWMGLVWFPRHFSCTMQSESMWIPAPAECQGPLTSCFTGGSWPRWWAWPLSPFFFRPGHSRVGQQPP